MIEMQALINGFALALTPVNLLFGFIGAVLGTAVGVLPVAVGLATSISRPIIASLTETSVRPACSIIPASRKPAPRVSVMLAPCMRV